MKPHENITGRIKNRMIDIALRNRRMIKKIPLLESAAKWIYFRTQLSESVSDRRDMVYLGDNRALTRTIFGHKMFVDTRDYSITPHILLDGYWEILITGFFKKIIREGMTVVEVGSNIGYYTLLASYLVGAHGKVYAFEANPDVFNTLFRNVEINDFMDRVTLVNKAVIDKSQKLKFNQLKYYHGSSSIIKDKTYLGKYVDEAKTIDVDATSIDEYFGGRDIKVDVMKIDAEGAEGLIFKGMRKLLEKNPNVKIICEFVPSLISTTGIDPRQFLEELKDYGFRLRVINKALIEEVSVDRILGSPYCELFLDREEKLRL